MNHSRRPKVRVLAFTLVVGRENIDHIPFLS